MLSWNLTRFFDFKFRVGLPRSPLLFNLQSEFPEENWFQIDSARSILQKIQPSELSKIILSKYGIMRHQSGLQSHHTKCWTLNSTKKRSKITSYSYSTSRETNSNEPQSAELHDSEPLGKKSKLFWLPSWETNLRLYMTQYVSNLCSNNYGQQKQFDWISI